jgi:hypothetical protein
MGRATAMRILRRLAGVLVWLVATVLLILAVVLSLTIVLLPLGVLVGFAALRLYGTGLKLLLPRSKDIEKHVRKRAGRGLRRITGRSKRWRRPFARKRGIRLPS